MIIVNLAEENSSDNNSSDNDISEDRGLSGLGDLGNQASQQNSCEGEEC